MPSSFKMTPASRIAFWFVLAILAGTVILALPVSVRDSQLSLVDALFTATSAVCVTGLTVVNIANTFSTFGQIVILILIQLGGLGIMTFSTLFFLAVGERLSLGQRMTITETFGAGGTVTIKTILKATFLLTIVMEAAGAILLFFPFSARMNPAQAAYFAVFHSVSAFCNAGFSVFESGLSEYDRSLSVLLGLAALIVIGGIGFSVASEMVRRIKNPATRQSLSLHTKLALTTTGLLLLGGMLSFYLVEKTNAYQQYPLHLKLIHSFFQSVTSRTAGFDPVNQGSLTNVGILVTIFLMIIGASPGSTGGGIKTTSFAIIMSVAFSRIKGSSGVNIFKRTVSSESVTKAISIFILATMIIFLATVALMIVESNFLAHNLSENGALDYFFEAVSAFGTVGLSLGVTPGLTSAGKIILVLVMFFGRVGLLTIAYMLARPQGSDRLVYSEESVMVG